jgi:maltose O-acetyltransferase
VREQIEYIIGLLTGRRVLPRGTQVGKNTWISSTAWIDPIANGSLVSIGDDVMISSDVRIFVHDESSRSAIGVTRVAPVTVGNGAFLGTGAIVLPGVSIGRRAIVAAGAVVSRNVDEGVLVAGVPAQVVGKSADIHVRRLGEMKRLRRFPRSIYGAIPLEKKYVEELLKAARDDREFYLVGDEGQEAMQEMA